MCQVFKFVNAVIGSRILWKEECFVEIKYTINENKVIASLKGELDEYSAEYVRLSLDSLLKDISCLNSPQFVMDFSGVVFMDSTGIGVLLGRYNKFSKKDINMFIKSPQGHVDRILKMTGIYELMPKIS